MEREHEEQQPARHRHQPLANLQRDDPPSDDGEPGTERVTDRTSDGDPVWVLVRCERDGCDLAPVPPLREEGEYERLEEDGRAHPPAETSHASHHPSRPRPRLELGLHLLHLLLDARVRVRPPRDVEQAASEEGVEDEGALVDDVLGDEVRDDEPERGGEDGHDRERADGAREDDDPRVPHGHDGGDDERLVAELGDEDHGDGAQERILEPAVAAVVHERVAVGVAALKPPARSQRPVVPQTRASVEAAVGVVEPAVAEAHRRTRGVGHAERREDREDEREGRQPARMLSSALCHLCV